MAIGLDNTNVNIGRKNSLKSRILEENESVYIQGCPCHIIHNTAKQGASAMAKNVSVKVSHGSNIFTS